MNKKLFGYVISTMDCLCIILSFFIAVLAREGRITWAGFDAIYRDAIFVLLLLYLVISRGYSKKSPKIFVRGYLSELLLIGKSYGMTMLIWFGYLFVAKQTLHYSRFIIITFIILGMNSTFVARAYVKLAAFVLFKNSKDIRICTVITVKNRAEEILAKIFEENQWNIKINGIILVDEDLIGEKIAGVEVTGNVNTLSNSLLYGAVDEVFINIPYGCELDLKKAMELFRQMGVMVYLSIDRYDIDMQKGSLDIFAGYQVISFTTSVYDQRGVVVKRAIDILGSMVGLGITLILTLLVAPAIKLESRGPVFFAQKRVGKNGRIFQIYKFRSMNMDAEVRKKELLVHNEMQGLMFKMTEDPRITKVGKFIRKTSIDEFPQFWNVLMGDMSLVGTRPPTEDEFLQYEGRHKRRLAMKPGITGIWQVSGRSNIDDFEDVVRMDLDYIDAWSVLLDVKLLVKTVFVVLFRFGAK